MDKETLSHYGWIVVLVLILSVLLALASPLGTFVAGAIKSTTAGFFNVNQSALGSVGINVNDLVFENCDHLETEVHNMSDTYTGDTVCLECGKVLSTGEKITFAHDGDVIPEGGKYTAADGTVYNPGDPFPETVTTGDKYRFGDYEYAYNMRSGGNLKWTADETINGWGVDTILNSKQTYSAILESINKKPITSLYSTFHSCTQIDTSPSIPETVTNMSSTYYGCSKLVNTATIPSGVTTMNGTFEKCSSLVNAPNLDHCTELTALQSTFRDCISLTDNGMPKISENITDLSYTFYGCNSLVNPNHFKIPSKVTTMFYAFGSCSSLVQTPDMSGAISLLDMTYTYIRCPKLVTTTEIPASVNQMLGTFWDCTSLKNVHNLPSNPALLYCTFKNCSSLVDLSHLVIPNSVWRMSETFMGCTSLKYAPIIPTGVQELDDVFNGCTSLTGELQIDMRYCIGYNAGERTFNGVDFEAQNLTLIGTSGYLDGLGSTGINYCSVCNGRHMKANEVHTCHGGETATCTQKSICMICNKEYGTLVLHDIVDGKCTVCNQNVIIIESAHNPFPDNLNNVVLGTWDFSDAKSVNITIAYQTIGANNDFAYIKSGNNYLNGDGQITTTAYKFGGYTYPCAVIGFQNVDMLIGEVTFTSDASINNYYGVLVQITPNY